MSTARTDIDRPTILRLAADADVDPRSVERALRGRPVRGRAGQRLARVLAERGLAPSTVADAGGHAA